MLLTTMVSFRKLFAVGCSAVSYILSTGSSAFAATGTPVPNGTWVNVLTDGFPIEAVGYDKMIYVPTIKESVMIGDYYTLTSEVNEALIGYNFTANRWDIVNLGGDYHREDMFDGGHPVGMFDWDPNDNSIVSLCCYAGSSQHDYARHMWWLDPAGQTARDKHDSPRPGLVTTATASFDPVHNRFVLFSANEGTWTYDPSANAWQQQTPSGTLPGNLYFPSSAFDNADQKVYLWAGATIYQSSYTNTLYTYDVPSNTWTLLHPSGPLPPARWQSGFAYDSTNNVFLMFGGFTSSNTVLDDTWIYDPAANSWTQLSPAASPPVKAGWAFQRLSYDPDDNVFVYAAIGAGGGFTGGSAPPGYGISTWFFRYRGTGPNVGTNPGVPQPSPGSLNRHSLDWANEPALAASNSALYLGWVETGQPFDSVGVQPHVYASQWSGTGWTSLTTSYLTLDVDPSHGGADENHELMAATVAGQPWLSWYSCCHLAAKSWNGSSWNGGLVGPGNLISTAPVSDYRSQVADVGGVATIAFLEEDRTYYPWAKLLYVKAWNGSSWTLKGTGPLNRNGPGKGVTADSVALASDGTKPYLAWTEYVEPQYGEDNIPQAYVSMWNGSAWVALGTSLNIDPSHRAYDITIACLNGVPYVSWVERSETGSPQVFVRSWNGSAWTLVGGPLNRNPLGWAYRPTLVADAASNSVYLGWAEQAAIGQKVQAYVSKYNAGSWAPIGGSLNIDPNAGSAERVHLAVYNGNPVAAWGESILGAARQIYVKQWNGSSWNFLGGNADLLPPARPQGLALE